MHGGHKPVTRPADCTLPMLRKRGHRAHSTPNPVCAGWHDRLTLRRRSAILNLLRVLGISNIQTGDFSIPNGVFSICSCNLLGVSGISNLVGCSRRWDKTRTNTKESRSFASSADCVASTARRHRRGDAADESAHSPATTERADSSVSAPRSRPRVVEAAQCRRS